MSRVVQDWLADAEHTGVNRWRNRDLAEAALAVGCDDPRPVYAAVALLDAASDFQKEHPAVPFDHICDAILDKGLIPHHEFRVRFRYDWLRFRSYLAWRARRWSRRRRGND